MPAPSAAHQMSASESEDEHSQSDQEDNPKPVKQERLSQSVHQESSSESDAGSSVPSKSTATPRGRASVKSEVASAKSTEGEEEEEESSDSEKESEDSDEEEEYEGLNLDNYYEVSKSCLLKGSNLEEDNLEFFILQCPKNVDPVSLQDKKLTFKGQSKLRASTKDGQEIKLDASLGCGEQAVNFVVGDKKSFKIVQLPVKGRLLMTERLDGLDVDPEEDFVSTFGGPKQKIPLPEGLKLRHPLFGIDFETLEKCHEVSSKKPRRLKRKREPEVKSSPPEEAAEESTPAPAEKKRRKKKYDQANIDDETLVIKREISSPKKNIKSEPVEEILDNSLSKPKKKKRKELQ